VGKSCILLRFADGTFTESYLSTIGIDFSSRIIDVQDQRIKLQIWDTAGQERFRTIVSSYYRGALGVLLVYDCTARESFENVKTWMASIDRHAPTSVVRVLVANKTDLADAKAVSSSEGRELAQEYGILFFETSAKTGLGVQEAFLETAQKILSQKREVENGARAGVVQLGTQDAPAPAKSTCPCS
jgi:small GTP-binding protein